MKKFAVSAVCFGTILVASTAYATPVASTSVKPVGPSIAANASTGMVRTAAGPGQSLSRSISASESEQPGQPASSSAMVLAGLGAMAIMVRRRWRRSN